MENRQNKPPKGGAASGHGGQKFHTDSEQAKLHKSKLRMESREERLNKARERLAKQKPPKKPGPIKRIARIAGHETHAFLHGKVYQEERDNVGVEGGHFVERSGEAALHYGRHKVRRAIREHPAKAAARAESRYIKATADYHSRKFAQEQPEAQSAAARLWHRHKLKREYQRKARETAKQTAKAAEQTASAMERFVREAAAFVKRHPVGALLFVAVFLLLGLGGRYKKAELPEERIFQRTILSNAEDVMDVCRELEAFCEVWGADMKQQMFSTMTVEELGMAILKHGFQGRTDGYLQLTAIMDEGGVLELHLRDDATTFNPFALDTSRASRDEAFDMDGMGVLVIKKRAKEFFYRRYQGFNTLIIKI